MSQPPTPDPTQAGAAHRAAQDRVPDPAQEALDEQLYQQREDALFHIRVLRDALALADDVGFALKQHSLVVATERPMTGGPARGADLTESYDRLLRAVRRTAMLARKVRADLIGDCRAIVKPAPAVPPPEPPAAPPPEPPAAPVLVAPPRANAPRARRASAERLDRLDNDRPEQCDEADDDIHDRDGADPEDHLPDRPLPDLIEQIYQDLAVADPRLPDARLPDARLPDARLPDARLPDARLPDPRLPDPRSLEPGAPPAAAPEPVIRWTNPRPPAEPAPPGMLTLDALSRRFPAPAPRAATRKDPPPD